MRHIAALAIASLLAAGTAQADESADQLGERGRKARAGNRYSAAVKAFKEAAKLDPNGDWICELGLTYAAMKKLPRAMLFVSRCPTTGTLAAAAARMRPRIQKQLDSGDYALTDIEVTPAGATVSLSIFEVDEGFQAPASVWLPFGNHTVTASAPGHHSAAVQVLLRSNVRSSVTLTLEPISEGEKAAGTGDRSVDFAADGGPGVGDVLSTDPKNVEHKTLLPKRFRGPSGPPERVTEPDSRVTAGVRAGLNMASFAGDGSDGLDSKLGFTGGAFLIYQLHPRIALQPELLFSSKGARSDATDETFTINYLVVPALARVPIPLGDAVDVGLVAGPGLGIALTSDVGGADVTRIEVSVAAGINISVPMPSGALVFDLRYEVGLTDANDTAGAELSNRAGSLSAGYTF